MSYLLDTNILSAHLRRPSGLQHRFVQHSGRLYTSSVALAELYDWAYRRPDPAHLTPRERLERFVVLQRRARQLLLASPEGYRQYWERNLRRRSIHVRF